MLCYTSTYTQTHTCKCSWLLPHLMLLRLTTTIPNNHTVKVPKADAMLINRSPLEMKTVKSMPSPGLYQSLSSRCYNVYCVLECKAPQQKCSLKSRISRTEKSKRICKTIYPPLRASNKNSHSYSFLPHSAPSAISFRCHPHHPLLRPPAIQPGPAVPAIWIQPTMQKTSKENPAHAQRTVSQERQSYD